MRTWIISLLIIFISVSVYADDIFTNRELKDIQVIEVNINEECAWIRDEEGNEEKVVVGDMIGVVGGIVSEIGNASITVQVNNTKTKMLVTYGFEQAGQ